MRIVPYAAFAALVVTAFITQAHAGEIDAAADAKISLIKAIETAEAHQGGKAIEASFDDDSFSPTYEVELVKDTSLYDVRVDAVNGKVLGVREDKDD